MSDQAALSLQDQFERSSASTRVPVSVPKRIAKQGYWLRASYTGASLSSSTTVPTAVSLNFTLNSLNNVASYVGVFDQYAIVCAIVRIRAPDNAVASPSVTPGVLHSVIDHDDSSGLTSVGMAQEYSTHMSTPGYISQTRVIYPRIAIAAYSGAFTSFANVRSYVDAGNAGVQHYGLKILCEPSVGSAFTYSTEVELVVHFRDTH